jgi:hypothetical protein
MKKLLIALLALTSLAAVAPRAEAGQFARVYTNRGVIYTHKSILYPTCSSGSRHHHHHHRSYVYAPYYRDYYRPSYVSYPSYSNYGYYRPSCGSSYHHHHTPHISFAFGF